MDEHERRIDPRAIPILFSLRGVDINQKTDEGETMLHISVRMRDLEVATVLLNAGADVNLKDDDGNTALSSALELETPSMVELLLKYNPDFNIDIVRTKFYENLQRSSFDCIKIVKSMLQHGFTVKETDRITSSMVWAAILDDLEELSISFVEVQRDLLVCVRHWYQSFLLHIQPFTENQTRMLETIKKINNLFGKGEPLETTGNHNMDLFNILLSEHDLDLMNVNVTSLGGQFSDEDDADIVAITTDVLQACYNSENPICDEMGRTGLHYAAKVGNVATIQALLDIHLDINSNDCNGKTAIDYAYDRIMELSDDEINDEEFNNQKHYDTDLACYFSLLDLKIGAVVLLKHVSKLLTANSHITLANIRTVKKLLYLFNNDEVIQPYYMSVYSYIERCESEIAALKESKLSELSHYDIISKNYNRIAPYTKRKEIIESLLLNDDILKKFEIFGPLLKHRFCVSNVRRGLLDAVEAIVFDVMKWHQIPLIAVREIVSNLNNNELYDIVSKT